MTTAEAIERTGRRLLLVVDVALVVSSAVLGFLLADFVAEHPTAGTCLGASVGAMAAMAWLIHVRTRTL